MAEAMQTAETPVETPPPSNLNPDAPLNGGESQQAGNGSGTLAESDIPEGEIKTPASFPENWREIMAGGDQKALGYFKRYASPSNVGKALLGLRSKMDAGEIIRSKPDGKDEAALNEWRAQAGIPESPEGYLEKVPDGLVIGEDDKPHVEDFVAAMHKADAPPTYVHEALKWYNAKKEADAIALADHDKEFRAQAEDTLRAEWGPEYRSNLTGIKSLIEAYAPKGMTERLFGARMPDGKAFGDDPDVLKFLVSLDKMVNPHGSVPLPDSAAGKAMSNEMETIRKAMGDRNSDYYRGPKDASGETQMARRYRELIELEQKRAR